MRKRYEGVATCRPKQPGDPLDKVKTLPNKEELTVDVFDVFVEKMERMSSKKVCV